MNLPALLPAAIRRRLAVAGNGHGPAAAGVKSLTQMRHASSAQWQFFPLSNLADATVFDYGGAVRDGLESSVVVAALCWMMRNIPDAPARLHRMERGRWNPVRSLHGNNTLADLVTLLRRPNPFYTARVLWQATVMDYAFGEAFWIKIRNAIGEVIQLWWVPRALIIPRWTADGTTFIHHYDYMAAGETVPLRPRDVVHFRFGMDPRNPRRGFSQLAAVMREIYTDEQAATFTASILRNLGVIGVIISPKALEGGPNAAASAQEDVKEVRDYIEANFTGEQRGKTLALGSPTEAQLLQYNLQGFDVGPIRDISEERVSAVTGIPAAVIGFGTGLQQTKVGATMKEMVKLAWDQCAIPTGRALGEQLSLAFEDDFGIDPENSRIAFDLSEVTAIWEDELQTRGDRVSNLFIKGVIKRGEARRELGLDTDPEDDVFVLPTTVAVEGDAPAASPAGAKPPPNAGAPPAQED